jgi:ubiquinol-cytochrome c reductase cytochrome b subunit
MRLLKTHPLLKLVNAYVIDASQPSNISYLWNFGSLLAVCLIVQIITGVTLSMHYNPSVLEAFNSIEHIMRDVNNGWLVRYLHSNTASAFFFLVYLHIGRGMYYGSYRAPRTLVWAIGTVIFILMMATAFLGYVLPYGQMSLWGATVITNLISAIPWIGQDIVEFIWGGFSVNNATLNRFFALHFVLPFVLAALALMHLIALHDVAGSSNPLGVSGNYDRLSFAPYYLFKDLITIFMLIGVLSIFVFFMPNVLGDSENYIMANPMQTPPAIVPEWYLLPFYAILRSIPNKLLGVIAMFSAILAILLLPITDLGRSKGLQFRPLSKIAFWVFVLNFAILMKLGACHVESPYIELGQISTVLYFSYFIIIIPFISLLENTLVDLNLLYRGKIVNSVAAKNTSYNILEHKGQPLQSALPSIVYVITIFIYLATTLNSDTNSVAMMDRLIELLQHIQAELLEALPNLQDSTVGALREALVRLIGFLGEGDGMVRTLIDGILEILRRGGR